MRPNIGNILSVSSDIGRDCLDCERMRQQLQAYASEAVMAKFWDEMEPLCIMQAYLGTTGKIVDFVPGLPEIMVAAMYVKLSVGSQFDHDPWV